MSIDNNIASNLWNAVTVTVDRYTEKIKQHDNSTFLGYSDVTLDATAVLPGFKLKLRGVGVKILKGSPYLDMPSEKGADGKYFPRFFPLSGELRQVMTIAVFQNEHVARAMENAAKQETPAQGVAEGASSNGPNPFQS